MTQPYNPQADFATQINLLKKIEDHQAHMAASLQRIADCMVYLANEQHANHSAADQIRWLGDGQDYAD